LIGITNIVNWWQSAAQSFPPFHQEEANLPLLRMTVAILVPLISAPLDIRPETGRRFAASTGGQGLEANLER
jgi:hypothetical protein